jgi:DNA-directed RNA polymerase specialized sigma subunit
MATSFNYQEAKTKDQELFDRWKQSGSKKDLNTLIGQLSGVIYSEVNRASGTLPTAALQLEAKKWTLKAIKTYDPSKGTTLNTHVSNYLPKIRRMNYKYQNAVRLPENMQLNFHEYNRNLNQLTEDLNRDPTDEEMSKALGWSKPHVIKFKNSLYADHIESANERPSEFSSYDDSSILMKHLTDQLTPDELYILNSTKSKSVSEIAQHLGVNTQRYNYLRSKLIRKVEDIKADIGLL